MPRVIPEESLVDEIDAAPPWQPVRVIDLCMTGRYPGTCDRCGRNDIRFLHVIAHEEEGRIEVGCECAKTLCCGYDGTQEEAKLRNRYHRRSHWLARRWKKSCNGNDMLRFPYGDTHVSVVIFRDHYGHLTYVINTGLKKCFSQQYLTSVEEAKLAAFDRLSEILDW